MENKPENFSGREREPIEKLRLTFSSKEEAIEIVKEFWNSMSYGRDILTAVKNSDNDWEQELTMGDRTRIMKGISPSERGGWVVLFQGNNQPLSEEAIVWLRNKGFM